MQCPTAVRTTESNSESVKVCWTPRGKNNSGSPTTMEDRSTGGLALPAVPPATVHESHTDSHRTGIRWNCKPEISTAQDSSAFTRRRMSIWISTTRSWQKATPRNREFGQKTRSHPRCNIFRRGSSGKYLRRSMPKRFT